MVYELSTGNNSVQSLGWDSKRSTLYAATERDFYSLTGQSLYRTADIPPWGKLDPDEDSRSRKRARPAGATASGSRKVRRRQSSADDDESGGNDSEEDGGDNTGDDFSEDDDDDDDEDDEDEDDEDGEEGWASDYDNPDSGVYVWPKQASHKEDYYGYTYDAPGHSLCTHPYLLLP